MLPADTELAYHGRHIRQIEEGLRQAERGAFATEQEVAAAYARWQQPFR